MKMIRLRLVGGTYREIATAMRLTEKQVKYRLGRILKPEVRAEIATANIQRDWTTKKRRKWARQAALKRPDERNQRTCAIVRSYLTKALPPEQIEEVRHLYGAGGITQKQLGARYGVGRSTMGDYIRAAR